VKGCRSMAKIKVALAITELNLGGAERCLTEIARRVDPQRFSPVVYCLGPRPLRPEASCLPMLEQSGIEVHFLKGRKNWQFPILVARLKKLLQAQSPQVLQTFLFHANVVGRIAARRAGVKTVVSGIRVAEHQSRWHLWIDHQTEDWVDRYVCVSRSVAQFSTTHGRIPPEKIVVIPNGVDLDRYPASQPAELASLGIEPGHPMVVFIGRLEPQKGIQWLIETSPTWLAELPNCHLVVVGEGCLRPRLEAICRDKRILGRVHFVGWRADVPEILAAGNLLVLPSAWEGMPNVVLEAMASRRPVVATKVEGIEELLGPGTARQTVQFGDAQALRDKIVGWIQNPSEAAAVGQENRRRAEENFSISRMVLAYEDLWESLATDKKIDRK
jgi:glycosyltransferase involved in cell wall biosynthesis